MRFAIRCATLIVGLLVLGIAGCARPHVKPIPPPPHRAVVAAPYERTWLALIQALAYENVPLRAVAKDSGVIALDDFVTPIGVYADCGSFGDMGVEGEAVTAFTLFVQPVNSRQTQIQINAKMRTQRHRSGGFGRVKSQPVLQCASTGRFEANVLETVRGLAEK
ncbi:MAG: hypothetical protein ACE5JN_05810 [Candidatus Methylomirabilia bacterium]